MTPPPAPGRRFLVGLPAQTRQQISREQAELEASGVIDAELAQMSAADGHA